MAPSFLILLFCLFPYVVDVDDVVVSSYASCVVQILCAKVQRICMAAAMAAAYAAVRVVIYLDNWKTGCRTHPFWPRSRQ